MAKYSEKLRGPRWQKKRLQILERDGWGCKLCMDTASTLMVHHRYYNHGVEPWDYPDEALVTLCQGCHEQEHAEEREAEAVVLKALRRRGVFNEDLWNIALELDESFQQPFRDLQFEVFRAELRDLLDAFNDPKAEEALHEKWKQRKGNQPS